MNENLNSIHLKKEINESTNQELKHIPDFILSLLVSRGVDTIDKIKSFLYPQITTLSDPFKILNMDKAIARLVRAYQNQEVVAVYGDYDLDGTFGLVLLKEGLNRLGFKNVIAVQPYRHHDGYGLHAAYIEKLKADFNASLVVTVDVGITAIEACEKAQNIGLDVIITDHHLAQETLPSAYCIVNPNQPEDNCDLKYLCGAGVGLYLIRALRKRLMDLGYETTLDIKELLPYYAIATITDMVPLIEDNRLLLKFAFESFKKVNNVGLKTLLTKLELQNRKLDTEDIGIKIAPKINALGRLEKDKLPMELLFIEDVLLANNYVCGLLDLNIKRRSLQEQGIQEVQKFLDKSIIDQQVLFYYSENIHPGVTGLIANHFMNELGIPCLVGSLDLATQRVVASGRKPDLCSGSLVDLMSAIKSNECEGGGHACAVGFEFHQGETERIRDSLKNYFSKNQDGRDLELKTGETKYDLEMKYDLEIKWNEISYRNYLWLEFLEPFGSGFPEPKFLLRNISFLQLAVLKNKHFKLIAMSSHSQEKVDFLLFNPSPRHKLLISESLDHLDVVVKLKKDKFRNTNKIQLMVEDLRRHEFIKTNKG